MLSCIKHACFHVFSPFSAYFSPHDIIAEKGLLILPSQILTRSLPFKWTPVIFVGPSLEGVCCGTRHIWDFSGYFVGSRMIVRRVALWIPRLLLSNACWVQEGSLYHRN